MQIFKNANYDFIRWRWHALVLSSVVIIGGLALALARNGMPLGIDFTGGTIVVLRFAAAGQRRRRAHGARRAARREGRAAVRRPGSARDPDSVPADAEPGAGVRARGQLAAGDRGDREGEHRQVRRAQHRGRRAGRRQGPAAEGHLRDDRLDRRHQHLHRAPVPADLRRRRARRDVPRHLRRAGDAVVFRLRAFAERRRRDPDDRRLFGERHDRHLRSRAREHAARCGASRSTRSSTSA